MSEENGSRKRIAIQFEDPPLPPDVILVRAPYDMELVEGACYALKQDDAQHWHLERVHDVVRYGDLPAMGTARVEPYRMTP